MEFLVGNAVVGQSGGPTAAINATLSGVLYFKIYYNFFLGLYKYFSSK